MKRTRIRTAAAWALIAALVPAAAFAAGQSEGSVDADSRAADTGAGELAVAAAQEPGNLDPCFGGTPITTSVVMAAYEAPVTYVTEEREGYARQVANDLEGWKPELAERVEVSDDRSTITFHLRRGVRFYPSGNEMTAADWIWSWRRQLSEPAIGWCRFENLQASITDPAQITAVDDYTVRVELNEANPRALPFMRFQMFAIYDSAEVKKHTSEDDPWAGEWLARNTAGTGPYYIAEWEVGRRILLERNPYYWGEGPAYERVEINIVPEESTRIALLQRGDVGLVKNVGPGLAERVGGGAGVSRLTIPSGNRVYLGFNVTEAPGENPTLREAVALAVPYEAVIEDIYEGYGRRYRSFVLPELEVYNPAGFPYETDLDRARELVSELDPAQRSLTLQVDAGAETEGDVAVLVQDYLSRVGLEVEVEPLPSGQFTSRLFGKDLGFFVTSGVSWIDDPATIVGLWMVSGAQGNFTGFSDPRVEEIQEEYRFAAPSPERRDAYEEAQRIYNEALNVVYLLLADHIVLKDEAVGGYTFYKDTATRFQDLRPSR
jgi:peptide/nickel transport system substrate-binding protein